MYVTIQFRIPRNNTKWCSVWQSDFGYPEIIQNGVDSIANGFTEYFANLNNTTHDRFDTDMEGHINSLYEDMMANFNSNSDDLPWGKIVCSEVLHIIKSLNERRPEVTIKFKMNV